MNSKWAAGALGLAVASMLCGCSKGSTLTSGASLQSTSTAHPSASNAGSKDITQLSGPEVAARAAAALRAAGSAHAKGTGMFFATKGARLDFVMATDSGKATVTTSTSNVQMIKVGPKSYVKASESFWALLKTPTNVRAKLAGKWVIIPAGTENKLLSLAGFADDVAHPRTGGKYKDKTSTLTYHGVRVVVLTQEDGSTIYIAATGPALPLFAHDAGKSSVSDMTIGEYGKKVTITAPTGAVDIATAAKA